MKAVEAEQPVDPPERARVDVVDRLHERLADEQGHDRQVVAVEPQRDQPDRRPRRRRRRRARSESTRSRQVRSRRAVGPERARGEDRIAVRAEAEEGDVAEIEQPGPADGDVQAEAEHRVQDAREADREDVDVVREQPEGEAGERRQPEPRPPADPRVERRQPPAPARSRGRGARRTARPTGRRRSAPQAVRGPRYSPQTFCSGALAEDPGGPHQHHAIRIPNTIRSEYWVEM